MCETYTNLTQYSNSELSLRVFNDEGLYSIRNDREYLLYIIEGHFIYTPEQMAELICDLDDDAGEES